jgi:diamine N-acetyltransferase
MDWEGSAVVGGAAQLDVRLLKENRGPMLTNMLTGPVITEVRSDEELLRCVDLLRTAFGTVAREYGLTEQSAPTSAAFTTIENLSRHQKDGLTLYGMFCDGLLIGCVATKKAKANGLVFYIERLAVAPEKRHRGYGGQLLSFALESIRGNGGTTASIGLMDNNEILKKWYRSKGFVQHDRRNIGHLPFKVCYMSMDLRQEQNG